MGLVRNLKKKLNNWVDITLAELCSAYIKQLAKQTTKKRDNSLLTTSSPKHLTTERQSTTIVTSSQDTSEKTIVSFNFRVDFADRAISGVKPIQERVDGYILE